MLKILRYPNKSHPHTEEFKRLRSLQYSGSGHPNYGKHFPPPSEDTRRKLSLALRGRKQSLQWIAKRTESQKGCHLSDETKAKISAKNKGRLKGENHPFYGKHHSPATKELISLKGKGRKLSDEARKHISDGHKGIKIEKRTQRQPKPIPVEKQLLCPICQKRFIPKSRNWKQKNCSRECVSIATSIRMKLNHPNINGERNGRWLGGKSFEPYTSEFNKQLKGDIRIRDNYTCQLCQTKENGHRDFPIHHIDFDKKNDNPINLVTLCDKCHSKTNTANKRTHYSTLLKTIVLEKYVSLYI